MRKKTLEVVATIVALVCVVIVSVTLILKKGEDSLTNEQMDAIAYLEEKTALTPVQITSVISFIQTESGFDPSFESPMVVMDYVNGHTIDMITSKSSLNKTVLVSIILHFS